MQAYTGFAEVYDIFMDNVPYDEWCQYISDILKDYDIRDGLVCELGCGTGKMTERMSKAGYDMIGIDNSAEMLAIAMRSRESDRDILYLNQDMREMELYGTVRACISICDSLNYLLSEEELLETFKLVNNYLDPGGLFIFDMNTEYKYRELMGDRTFCENREACSFIWENYYDENDRINEYDLTLFVREDEEEEVYRKYEEIHYQKSYGIDTVCDLIKESGMELVAVYGEGSRDYPSADCERAIFVAREISK